MQDVETVNEELVQDQEPKSIPKFRKQSISKLTSGDGFFGCLTSNTDRVFRKW